MNAKKRILVILAVVVLAAIVYMVWSHIVEEEKADSLTLYGNVDIREVELAFRVAGRLRSMRFDEGDTIDAGTLLAELDSEPYEEALAVACRQQREFLLFLFQAFLMTSPSKMEMVCLPRWARYSSR